MSRISQQQLESYLWGAAVLLRGTIDAGDYKQFIFPLLFFKRLCDVYGEETQTALTESGGDANFAAYPENHRFQVPPDAHWLMVRQAANNVGPVIQSAMRAIETANPDKLYGIFGDAQWTNKDRLSDAMLRDLVEHFSTLELTIANLPEDELGQGYEYLIKKFADDSGHTAAEFYTNRTVVHLMTEMLAPQSGESIYDPTCGSGGMLLSCIAHLRRQEKEWRNVRLFGQERNLMTSSIARMNCFLHGIEDFQIVRGDTLSEPKLVEGDHLKQFDVCLANPPYSIKQWDRDAFASDPWGRNLYGTPPQGRADYAFWQHIMLSLAPVTGRCAILFPHGVLFRKEEAEMRRKLIEADVIECVLGLGPNLFYNSPMEACVVICRASKPKERKGQILFINAVNEVTRERAQSFLTDNHIERVVQIYRKFKTEAGFSFIASQNEILGKDGNLSIPLYVEPPTTNGALEVNETPTLEKLLNTWLETCNEASDMLEQFFPIPGRSKLEKCQLDNNIFRLVKSKSEWVRDRIDLDTQITATFNASDVPNMVGVATRQELQTLLGQDVRKVLITTIHKFGEAGGILNDRSNIIVMVDEAHRTQEGDLGRKMREALPNAFLFGLTGTPINRADRNTYWAFGADEDEKGYMSRYSFQDSIRDKATLPLHFEAPEIKLKIDRDAIDEAYRQITGDLSEQDRDDLAKRAAKMAVLVKNPERVRAVVNHIVQHFQAKVEPNGFKAQVVVFDRECCVLYKTVFDELIGADASAVVMSSAQNDPPAWKEHIRDKDAEEKLLERFRNPADPLKFVIVTNKLLTGFDAPILQVMYLDKPMKDHNLLQAICRTNRTFGQEKTHGLIVDYIGIFDDVARALDFDEKAVQQVISNIEELRKALPMHMQKCLAFFSGVDRNLGGYEGLMAAQQKLPNNEARDKFASEYTVLGNIWEALSPDPVLSPYEKDYRWLTQVYESVKPPSGNGKLLWHALGAKTVELINENVHVESVRDDIETLVLDAQVLEEILDAADPAKKGKEIEIKLIARLRKHLGNPKFTELGERLEKVKERHEQGFLTSLDFLKEVLELAKEVLEAEKGADPEEERDRAKEALTELFAEAKTSNTHIIVERIVADIDDIVKKVRFPDWQHTSQGERLVQKELRRTLLKYKLHTDQELFDKAYNYIRQYY